MPSVYRSLVFSFIEKFSLIGITLFSYILIARLLTPEEIGIYSVAAALIAIAQVVREFGVGNYLIQEKDITKQHIQTAFGVSLMIGALLFIIAFFTSPYVGSFYKDDRMVVIVRIISLNFLIMPFCSISIALLRREMQFDRLMTVNITAAVIGTASTVGLAFLNFGPQSLAWGAITTNITAGFTAWLIRDANKTLMPSLTNWNKVFSFGSKSASVGVLTALAMGINDLAIGRMLGFAPAAVISRANGLVAMFSQQIMDSVRSVALPAFARANRANQPLEPIYISSVSAVTVISWPFYGLLAIHSSIILNLMFGPQWENAAKLVPIFCLSAAIASTYNLVLTLAISIGRIDLATKTDFIMQPTRALIVVISLLTFNSLEAVAWSTLLFNIIGAPYLWLVKDKVVKTDKIIMLKGLTASFLVATFSLITSYYLSLLINIFYKSDVILFLVQALLLAPILIVTIFVFRHPLSNDPIILATRTKIIKFSPYLVYLLPIKMP